MGHQMERLRFPRDGRCAWLLRMCFSGRVGPAGPCLGEDGKNVPRSRIFPARMRAHEFAFEGTIQGGKLELEYKHVPFELTDPKTGETISS